MTMTPAAESLRDQARAIWQSAVDAVRPRELMQSVFADLDLHLAEQLKPARRIIVVGAGKAGAAMASAVEDILSDRLDRIEGIVNVPAALNGNAGECTPPQRIRLHAARPAGTNQPTADGVIGAEQMLQLVTSAAAEDVVLCLLSGGGSALLPLPVEGVKLADKQQVTKLLHACGATINEMNAVRKHLSGIKGGRLAQACSAGALYSLIISDVIGDPLDVIASGPTAPDPTTFTDALAVLQKYDLVHQVVPAVLDYLLRGQRGEVPESPKKLPNTVHNVIIGNNQRALRAAQSNAEQLGYRVLNLGSYLEGETREVGIALAGLVRSIRRDGWPLAPPACVLSGGETTVTLAREHGRGGRNQELVLALAHKLGAAAMTGVAALSGGTDGEDGPTDAAGAVADAETLRHAAQLNLDAGEFLRRNDAYSFFEQTGDLIKTGLTQTNVMDVRVLLVT